MTRKVKRVAPLQLGQMMGILYGLMGLIFLPFFFLAGLAGAFAQHATNDNSGATAAAAGVMFGFGLFMPVMYAVFGFIFGVISAALYNLVARWIGGIEVEVE
jgi:membrane associated rhomboid family serine protease